MDYATLLPLILINFVDAISYMVVAPSIIFYVLQLGGNNAQYGLVLSVFSFASFTCKPILGFWSDATGSFRIPYMVSTAMAILGGLAYFFASVATTPLYGVGLVIVGRVLGGMGAANSTLAFGYMAKVMPPEAQTRANIALNMTRIIGMALGPGFNVGLAAVQGSYSWFGQRTIPIDPLNSVGLVLVITNVIILLDIILFVHDPEVDEVEKALEDAAKRNASNQPQGHQTVSLMQAVCSVKILAPIVTIFSLNATFQLIETGFAPAANHSLGWGPIQTSAVLGGTAIIISIGMVIVYFLSSRGMTDEQLLSGGLVLSMIGNYLLYLLWVSHGEPWQYYLPIIISCLAFPFIAAPNRSILTYAVSHDPALEEHQGVMQALLGMFSSLAGFVAPGFVAVYILRDPSQVNASSDHRELSPMGLIAPLLPLLSLVFVCWAWCGKTKEEETTTTTTTTTSAASADEEKQASETTGLVPQKSYSRPSSAVKNRRSSVKMQINNPRVQDHRRSSVAMMGGMGVQWDIMKEDQDKEEELN